MYCIFDVHVPGDSPDMVLKQVSHASCKGLDFFLENSRSWKVLENHFGPGKSWKNILESDAFL